MTNVNMDLNMETLTFHAELTWNLHVNANSGTQFRACLHIGYHIILIEFYTKLNPNHNCCLAYVL